MDGGPFRVPRPADRRVTGRQEPAPRPPEVPQMAEEPKAVHHQAAPRHTAAKEKSMKRFIVPIIAAIVVIVAGIFGWSAWSGSQNTATAIDSGKYQAVFFTNGQVYFGKLSSFNSGYMKLTDIYYLQNQASGGSDSKNPQKTSNDQNNVQLVKLGDEIHGPEDEMIISRDQVLFYENLKADGKVAQSIDKYKNTK